MVRSERQEMMRLSTETRLWLLKIGSVAAVLGSLCAAVGNVLHPVTPRDDPRGVAQVIADSAAWTLIHIVIFVGILFMLAGLVAIRYSIDGGIAEALARLGVYVAIIGVTIGLVTVILDGVAAKQLADQWAAAPEAEKMVALSAVSTNETLNFALAGLFNLSFAGVPFLLFGLAVGIGGAYPRWLGWIAAFAGAGSIAAGLVQAFTGEPTTASLVLTIIGPTVISLWLLVMGVLVGRRAARERSALQKTAGEPVERP
jgi:predicted transporter